MVLHSPGGLKRDCTWNLILTVNFLLTSQHIVSAAPRWPEKENKLQFQASHLFACGKFVWLIVTLSLKVSTTSPTTTYRAEEEEVATRALAPTTLSTTTQWATAGAKAAWITSTDRLCYYSVCESLAPSSLHQCLKPKKVIDGLPVLSAFSMFASYVLLGFYVAHVGTNWDVWTL